MNGSEQMAKMQQAGFQPEEISQWADQQRQRLTSAGFGEAETNAYFGVKEPNLEPVRAAVQENLSGPAAAQQMTEFATAHALQVSRIAASPTEEPIFAPAQRAMIDRGSPVTKIVGAKPARTFDDALSAGLQISVSGLLARGKEPDKVLTDDAPMASRIAANVGTVIGDLPFMAAGAVIGGGAGAPSGPGLVVTAGAGAFGLPAGFRATLMDAYQNGEFKNFRDFWERASGIIWEEVKGEMTGAATAGAGVAAKVALPAGASAATRALVPTTAEIATMVSVGKALEGQVPSMQDFGDAAVMLGGFKLATSAPALTAKLQDVYRKTGTTPREIVEQAQRDPTVLQDIVSDNRDVPEAFELTPESPDYQPSLSDPEYRRELSGMREQTGWAEVGGRMIREYDDGTGEQGEVTGRTKWIPNAPWWEGRPKGLTEERTKAAIDKALNGERLGAAEQRTIDYMLGWARDNVIEPTRQMDEGERAAIANDLATLSLDQSSRNIREVDLIARAVEHDEGAVESAAIAHPDNHAAFMAEVRRINERADAHAEDASGGEGAGETPRQREAARAALEAEGSVRELSQGELARAAGGSAAAPPMRPPAAGARPASSPEPSPAQQAVLDRVSVGEREHHAFDWDELYTNTKDELYPIRVITDALRGDETLTASKDPYKLARLTRGMAGKADQFLTLSPFKFKTYENVGKALKTILDPVKDDLDGLRSYMVSKRAVELAGRDIETGVPLDEAKAVVREGKAYEPIFREILEYQEHLVRYLVDAGVMSKDGAAAMREANRDYVPFFRLMDEDARGGARPGMSVRNPVKAIKGSTRKIIDPLESIIKNTYLYTALAEHNAVGNALVDLAEKAGGSELVQKVKGASKPIEVSEQEVARFLEEHGIDADAEAFTIFRRNNMNLADDQILVMRDGKREIYEVPKPVAAAFMAADRESAGMLAKILAIPARTLRAGATLAPDFMLRNFNRDQLSATILSKNGYVPVLDFMRGFASVIGKDDDFQSWLKSGGANATMISMDRQYLQLKVNEIAEIQGVAAKAWNVVKLPIEMLRVASELVENATRMGEFKRAVGDGGKEAIQEAGFESREVTLDFARMGAKTRGMNMITAFFNAQIEGVDRTVRAFRDAPLATTLKVGAVVTMPSLLLWWANHDDPRWKEIPDWERDLFWIVLTKDHIYRIPKPFELGMIFGSLPERMLDKWVADKPDAMNNIGKSMLRVFGVNLVPTAAAPVLEHMTNYSFFTDRPLIPSNLEKLLPEYQFTPYTTEATKALGRMIGAVPGMHESSAASPLVIDNYVRGWSGTLGVYAVQLADAALRKAGVLPDPVLPAATLADMPVIKAFVVRYPSAQAQSIQDFNEHYKDGKQVVDTISYLAKHGDFDAALKESRVDPLKIIKLDGIHEALSNSQRVVQMIYKNPTIPADEKRQLIDSAYQQMIDMAREGETMLRALKKELGPRFGKEAKQAAPAMAAATP